MLKRMITNLKNVIIKPSEAFPRIIQENDMKSAVLVLCIVAVLYSLPGGFDPLMILALGIIILLYWQIDTTIMHFAAKMFGAKGSRRSLLIGSAYAWAVDIYLTPLVLIGMDGLAGLIAFVWIACLTVLAIKNTYSVSTGKGVGILVLSNIIQLVLIGIIVFLSAPYLESLRNQMQ